MSIKKIQFLVSNTELSKLPAPNKPEYAFVGRSNVGKSSLINMLANSKKLAKTSGTPGKTQTINHFLVDDSWYLVDLPGYGYAKVSKTKRRAWMGFTKDYLVNRENLYCVFVLIDARHEPLSNDLEFVYNLGINQVPFALIFTKIDKISRKKLDEHVTAFKEKFLMHFEFVPDVFYTSAISREGRDELLHFIKTVTEQNPIA